ncbi:MAG: Cupin [Gaiellales bacterium]|jgi:uncharacterized cupin superfamily protein|nr:Cupin [Gaiellales bacterium]
MSGYTILRGSEVPDYTGDAPGAFLGYGGALGTEQVSVNMRVLAPHTAHAPPGYPPTTGHSHRTIEEIYVVLQGELTVKLGDEVARLGPRDAVRVSATTPRAVHNDSDHEAALLMISVKVEDQSGESQWHERFWPES